MNWEDAETVTPQFYPAAIHAKLTGLGVKGYSVDDLLAQLADCAGLEDCLDFMQGMAEHRGEYVYFTGSRTETEATDAQA